MEEVVIAYGIGEAENGKVLAIGTKAEIDEWIVQNCTKRSFWIAKYRVGEAPQFPIPITPEEGETTSGLTRYLYNKTRREERSAATPDQHLEQKIREAVAAEQARCIRWIDSIYLPQKLSIIEGIRSGAPPMAPGDHIAFERERSARMMRDRMIEYVGTQEWLSKSDRECLMGRLASVPTRKPPLHKDGSHCTAPDEATCGRAHLPAGWPNKEPSKP